METPIQRLFSLIRRLSSGNTADIVVSRVHARGVSVGRVSLAIDWTTLKVAIRQEQVNEDVRHQYYSVALSPLDAVRARMLIRRLRWIAKYLHEDRLVADSPAAKADTLRDTIQLVRVLGNGQ